MNNQCNHKMKESSWIGTFVSKEFFLALNKGYKILLFFSFIYIDTTVVSSHREAELFGQIPMAKAVERKHSRHECDVI